MIESIREEWAHLGVRFTTLMPGAILTPIWETNEEEIPRDEMMTIEDFMHVFTMVVTSPNNIQFPEIVFYTRRGGFE